MTESRTTRFNLPRWTADTDFGSRQDFDDAFVQLELLTTGYLEPLVADLPTPSGATKGFIARTVDTRQLFFGTSLDWIEFTPSRATYGTGSDGAVTITSNTTLTSDRHYTTLTVNAGATLFPNSYRLFAQKQIVCNGIIDVSGAAASSSAGAAGAGIGIGGTLGSGANGGNGGTPAAEGTAAAFTGSGNYPTAKPSNSQGFDGRWGGNGGYGGTGALGNYGGATTIGFSQKGNSRLLGTLSHALDGAYVINWDTALGEPKWYRIDGGLGGIGGVAGTGNGGGGGGGGGVMMIATPRLTGLGSVYANGGNGAVGGTNGGGGGGGGGGVILLVGVNRSGVTVQAAGGLGGAGNGTGGAGVNGAVGRVVETVSAG